LTTKLFCEVYAKRILPALRALVAKIMVNEYGLTQLDAAKMLGVTQASINYYLTGKRGHKLLVELESIDTVYRIAKNIAKRLIEGRMDSLDYLCRLCMFLRENTNVLERVLKASSARNVKIASTKVVDVES